MNWQSRPDRFGLQTQVELRHTPPSLHFTEQPGHCQHFENETDMIPDNMQIPAPLDNTNNKKEEGRHTLSVTELDSPIDIDIGTASNF